MHFCSNHFEFSYNVLLVCKMIVFRKGSVISVWDVQSGSSTTQTDVVNAVMDIISSGEVGGNEVDSQAGPAVHELENMPGEKYELRLESFRVEKF